MDVDGRRRVMSVLARSSANAVHARLQTLHEVPRYEDARRPECGLVMLRGRIAGSGAPFNLGEATVSRAAVALDTGETGFSYVLGRDLAKARSAALVDALWQRADWREKIEAVVVAPLAAALDAADNRGAAETAATRVDFFTLVRGED
jgi:alpha-D-ribose 1-methylphosphonate 5-triphosphate synthase subunit PhnG